jgi:hypothetical protein
LLILEHIEDIKKFVKKNKPKDWSVFNLNIS